MKITNNTKIAIDGLTLLKSLESVSINLCFFDLQSQQSQQSQQSWYAR